MTIAVPSYLLCRVLRSATLLIAITLFAALFSVGQTFTVLHTFTGGTDGALGTGIIHGKGALYGTTGYGGDPNCNSDFNPTGCGTIFKINAAGKETIIHSFTGSPDGQDPNGSLLIDRNDLYGTTFEGGAGYGIVFELDGQGQRIAQYDFAGEPDAGYPTSALVPAGPGVFYGAGYFGGAQNDGAIFKLTFNSGGTGTDEILHSFTGAPSDGANPDFPIIVQSGVMFGSTVYGGSGACNNGFAQGCGTVYKLTASSETALYNFSGPDGEYPTMLIGDPTGGFFGLTSAGGASGNGTVFSLKQNGTFTSLYSFSGSSDGSSPDGLAQDLSGNLFGVAAVGGPNNAGTIFELSPNGQGGWSEKTLYSFTGAADGSGPQPSFVLDERDHLIYGATITGGDTTCNAPYGCGTVFELSY
jgi:uncharacterized repeat protein (TIGR03803 family)